VALSRRPSGEPDRAGGFPVSGAPTPIGQRVAAAGPRERRPLGGLLDRLVDAALLVGPVDRAVSELAVLGVTEDSRAVVGGRVFVAVPGFHVDGHAFAAAAASAGAAVAVVERALPELTIPQLVVRDARHALAIAANWWYGDPSHHLGVVGVTGTDGKTTTSFLAAAALEASGLRAGLIGTVETRVGRLSERHEAHVTTPSAPELQATLAAMVEARDDAAVVETTSHALELDRVLGVAYDAAVFTNLTHEHLELHGTFERYRAAKLRLFEALAGGPANPPKTVAGRSWPKVAVVNVDDPSAPWFETAAQAAGARIVSYGWEPTADVRAVAASEDASHLTVAYEAPSGPAELELRLAGRFNVSNALAVVALGEALGLPPASVRAGLASVPAVPGRMERIAQGQPFSVVVDYAHSPASLEGVLEILAPVARQAGGGLIAVFGSAGERDTAKRAVMGRIAGERCRLVVATDEDPRGEDRTAIVREIVAGAVSAGRTEGVDVLGIPDRRAAIAAAFERALPGDVVLLAGKGHEPTILYASGAIPWDEAGVARETLASMGFAGG
jgi:UDP-N-acetylmuramoyl-L-alanyl-D-glutamate--2,6-diaminopimelate ligase